jgi:hypothetical protein
MSVVLTTLVLVTVVMMGWFRNLILYSSVSVIVTMVVLVIGDDTIMVFGPWVMGCTVGMGEVPTFNFSRNSVPTCKKGFHKIPNISPDNITCLLGSNKLCCSSCK